MGFRALVLPCCAAAIVPAALFASAAPALAQSSFNEQFAKLRAEPQFQHSTFGVEVFSIDRNKVIYAWNGDKFVYPASTAKLVTEGMALAVLGPDYRFHTYLYRTGPLTDGVVEGDVVLVASGDPNLSGRLQADGTLGFSNEDHSYGGFDATLVPGDPAAPMKALAKQVAALGIRKITGRVLVDASLFPEGEREVGTGVTVSPVSVNDNVIDILVTPGAKPGDAVSIQATPAVSSIRFVNQIKTSAASTEPALSQTERDGSDGELVVTLSGTIPLGRGTYDKAYAVASPSRFAAVLLSDTLKAAGVEVAGGTASPTASDAPQTAGLVAENRIGELVSAPLSEDVKVTLKTSQNLHAMMMPYIVGSVRGHGDGSVIRRGFRVERNFLANAGLDIDGAAQWDGEGGGMFTPDFMVRYLAYMARQPTFKVFKASLPVLGQDGTLHDAGKAAKGAVFAKTGTFGARDFVNNRIFLSAKGLAGYTTTPSGELVAIAVYVANVPVESTLDDMPAALNAITKVAGNPIADISAAIHLLPITSPQ